MDKTEIGIMDDTQLREYVKKEFVDAGFIHIEQWRNFIDYLQILLKKEREKTKMNKKIRRKYFYIFGLIIGFLVIIIVPSISIKLLGLLLMYTQWDSLNMNKETQLKEENYIARVPIRGMIIIRKEFRENGYVKISKITKEELNKVFSIQEENAKEELPLGYITILGDSKMVRKKPKSI